MTVPARAWVLWWAGGACAVALVGMAWWGEERTGSLAEYVAGGVMKDTLPAQVRMVALSATGRSDLRYVRADVSAPWLRVAGEVKQGVNPPISQNTSQKLDELLMLLHNSAPERTLEAAVPDLAAYGLTPAQALRLSVGTSDSPSAPPSLQVEFGARNPIGLSNYARVVAQPSHQGNVLLLPAYVADAAYALWPAP